MDGAIRLEWHLTTSAKQFKVKVNMPFAFLKELEEEIDRPISPVMRVQ